MSEEKLYLVYRPLYMKPKIINPGAVVKCTKLEAMCINTMQPMTLRETNETIKK